MNKFKALTAASFIAAFALGGTLIGSGALAQQADVACSPSIVSTAVGQSVTLTASGGDGEYTWSSPGLVITNPNGVNFTATFNAAGTYPVTVISDGESAACNVAVTGTTAPPVFPGLPNTGELPQ